MRRILLDSSTSIKMKINIWKWRLIKKWTMKDRNVFQVMILQKVSRFKDKMEVIFHTQTNNWHHRRKILKMFKLNWILKMISCQVNNGHRCVQCFHQLHHSRKVLREKFKIWIRFTISASSLVNKWYNQKNHKDLLFFQGKHILIKLAYRI